MSSNRKKVVSQALQISHKKRLRSECHRYFDKLWKCKGGMTRIQAYTWLAKCLKMPISECHFSTMTLSDLMKAKLFILKKSAEWQKRGKRSLTRRRRANLCGLSAANERGEYLSCEDI
ncbi:zinc-finger-containing protein [Parasutterella muris]|uniref:Uncharacterized protein n=1 Tax=Parasutterella muris TaxID=2565572 RepID=A0A6L6YGL2_9BURK|nr:hypothetical protein [Parasutterella muris]